MPDNQTDIALLEQYFDSLLEADIPDSLLADDAPRFDVYDSFRKAALQLCRILSSFKEKQHVSEDSLSFLAKVGEVGNEELDRSVRTMALEEQLNGTAPEDVFRFLGYLSVQLRSAENQEAHDMAASQLQEEIDGLVASAPEEGKEVLSSCQMMEEDLVAAKQGILAKDAKMIATLRKIRFGKGKSLAREMVARAKENEQYARIAVCYESIRRIAEMKDEEARTPLDFGKRLPKKRSGKSID